MKRYFIYFKYDGTRYHGWQIQPNGDTIQAQLQKALSTIMRQDVEVVGAGRTDTSVHARMMVAHTEMETQMPCDQITYKVNRILPRDIAVIRTTEVPDAMHARFSATRRTYHYYLHTERDPFLRQYSWECYCELDFELMNEAAEHLLHVDDFAAFCKSKTDVKTTLCNVTEARWIQTSPTTWYFRISANRFLRNMVRAVVGTLVDVGRKRISIADFDNIVSGKKRTEAGESMPAHALFLEEIEYPDPSTFEKE